MRIAVPKEIMNNENRVALTPLEVQTLVKDGHEVLVETGALVSLFSPTSTWRQTARGLRAEVTVLDLDPHVLQRFDDQYQGTVRTLISDPATLEAELLEADLVIGAVLVPGAAAPKLVREETVKKMKPGAVLVDVAIEQGGCFENPHKTSHDDPTFKVHDTIFYCVANMPGAVANTSARALNSVTLPYIRAAFSWED
ncbi:TPA: hypothetical protein OT021_001630 [Corynebacterium striatum]|uniref:hypothetical protein n=1 Tax=Corynebacterium striatum TaxID=43770 RepID=UPI00080BC81A|nr:hypothetical protein [Corynebacterium striatum]HCT5225628.1 hypothetical protein [Corynebacterium striatum]HEI8411490.1 hypothetical protein [Corynebacterium striatum]